MVRRQEVPPRKRTVALGAELQARAQMVETNFGIEALTQSTRGPSRCHEMKLKLGVKGVKRT
jgi:hypothetical protein